MLRISVYAVRGDPLVRDGPSEKREISREVKTHGCPERISLVNSAFEPSHFALFRDGRRFSTFILVQKNRAKKSVFIFDHTSLGPYI